MNELHITPSTPIPDTLSILTNLIALVISGGGSSLSLPPSLINTTVNDLYAPSCNLSGSIPPELFQLPYLRNLDLSGNQLTGKLPPFGALPYLTFLDLRNNQLSGTIPASYANLTKLQQLYLQDNAFAPSYWPYNEPNVSRYYKCNTTGIPICCGSTVTFPFCGVAACTDCSPSPTAPFLAPSPSNFAQALSPSLPSPSALPGTCSGFQPPSFSCIDGTWTSSSNVTIAPSAGSPFFHTYSHCLTHLQLGYIYTESFLINGTLEITPGAELSLKASGSILGT